MTCLLCGGKIKREDTHCKKCGSRLDSKTNEGASK